MRYGGFWRRVVAVVIDWFLVNLPPLAIVLIFGSDYPLFDVTEFINEENDLEKLYEYELNIRGQLIFVATWWLYEATMTSSKFQATVGKLCLGLIVVDEQEQRLTFGRATGRHFAKYISSFLLGIGYLMVAFTKHKQGAHDFVAKTYVLVKAAVREEGEAPQEELDAKF